MPAPDTAYLSARVPASLRNRFKSIAARRGQKVQDLLNQIVEDYVEREDKGAPVATDIIRKLRMHRDELGRIGVRHLFLFGSVARGQARPDSDIDLAYELDPARKFSLFDIGRLEQEIESILGSANKIDFASRKDLFGQVRESTLADEIRVF
ncbi:nucleotidyltransferase domain-containing protein [Rhizobiales bacterium]|uniref:nucleotidyltransferase domain-containing protein n=1 Tax=Hongsoonwoonella zoysiae TaxID=2821844 RepID=UPI00155F7B6E|nr:nucleotidyltransferase domain-containing protein [Hongsoonwoonella zoysiae]NRG16674.1 nucleotidyltransferase domain-containing protein [Hongsoonwoonella zoysiae]